MSFFIETTKKTAEPPFSHTNKLNYKLVLGFALLLLFTRIGLGSMMTSASDITVENVASAINEERSGRNIATLTYNSKLAAAADFKSNDMIQRKYFSHTDPEGKYIWDKIVEYGYTPYTVLGENLAVDFSSTEGLVAAWIASPTHRANLLNTSFKDQGVGVVFGSTSRGEFSSAITNTFGAQPTASQQTPKPQPEQPKPTTPKPETPKPTPTTPSPETPKPDKPIENVEADTKEPDVTEVNIGESAKFVADKISVNADVVNDKLNINVYIPVTGSVKSVNATVLDQTVALTQKNGGYAGTLVFDKYFTYSERTLVLSATSTSGEESFYNFALKNIQLAPGENPKDLGNIVEKAAQPDLYNTFKYIVIIFGGLFLLFLFTDTLHLSVKKGPELTSGRGSHLIVLFLMLSTMLLVTWWH